MTAGAADGTTAIRERAMAVAAALVALLGTSAAQAGDGVLEINQACVATGCFPGDAPGFPVTTAANTSYVLTSSLVVPGADTTAIQVAARTALDLAGFTISGPTTCTGEPAVCAGAGSGVGVDTSADGAWIRNGTIRGMGSYGIRGGDDTRVEAVTLESNGGDGVNGGYGSYGWRVERCAINSNGGSGVNVNFGGGGSTVIRGNAMRWNAERGAVGLDLLVVENTFVGNGQQGIAGNGGYAQNVLVDNNGGSANAQVLGLYQIGTNVCGNDTTCP